MENNTICPHCGKTVIERKGRLRGEEMAVSRQGQCSACGTTIAGVWE